MKKIHLLFLVPILLVACKSKPATETTAAKPDSAVTYPFGVKDPDQWNMNHNSKNSLLALNVLKAFEERDTSKFGKYFADTVELWYDGGQFNGPVGEMNKAAKQEMDQYSDIKLRIVDVESVIGKAAPKDEWVSVWYIQTTKDLKGKTDSVALVNDLLIKGDKVSKFHEYARHFSPKK